MRLLANLEGYGQRPLVAVIAGCLFLGLVGCAIRKHGIQSADGGAIAPCEVPDTLLQHRDKPALPLPIYPPPEITSPLYNPTITLPPLVPPLKPLREGGGYHGDFYFDPSSDYLREYRFSDPSSRYLREYRFSDPSSDYYRGHSLDHPSRGSPLSDNSVVWAPDPRDAGILKQLDDGRIAFQPPATMQEGESKVLEVRITRSQTEDIARSLARAGESARRSSSKILKLLVA